MLEVLSRRSFQQQDLTNKPVLYAQLGVAEYMPKPFTAEELSSRIRRLLTRIGR